MRNSRLPLTETVYYLLLVFKKPTYGYLAIKEIEELSEGDVRIAAGTMYGAIENLLKSEMIVQVSSENERRKMYETTAYGNEVLEEEVARLSHCVRVWEKLNR